MKFGLEIGIDLGTSTTLIYVKGKGVVLHEPSVVAVNAKTGKVLAVGRDAYAMVGRTPEAVSIIMPLRDGVISDFKATEVLLKTLISQVNKGFLNSYFRPSMVVCVPSEVSPVEQKAVEDTCRNAGAKEVFLIREPVAAAIGAGVDITRAQGCMVVDIGGGTTDIAVISLCQPVVASSLKVAGNRFDEAIIRYVKRQHNLLIGEKTAEALKVSLGGAYPREEEQTMEVNGRSLITGLPGQAVITSTELLEALEEPISQIFEAVHNVLEQTPPELMGDIRERGVILTGGGAMLYGIDRMLASRIGVEVTVADKAEQCVVIGTGRALTMLDKFTALS